MRDTILLNAVVEDIANREGRVDGLIAAAAIQQETPALEYSAKDSNALLEVNVTGVFMTAQAVARQMVRFGNGGSIVLVASMSGTVVNRVGCFLFLSFYLYSIFLSSFLSILLSFFFFFFFFFHRLGSYQSFASLPPPYTIIPILRISSLMQTGLNLSRLQRKQSSRDPTISQPRRRMGSVQYPRQHPLPRLHPRPDVGDDVR